MSNEITTEVKNYIIVFFDKSKLWITQGDYDVLQAAYSDPDAKMVQLGSSTYNLSGIDKILTMEEFYEAYPDQRPDPLSSKNFEKPDDVPDYRGEKLSRNGLASMIKGMQGAIEEFRANGHEPVKAIGEQAKLIKKYERQYAEGK